MLNNSKNSNIKSKKSFLGFTLAEVLMALAVTGIVMAITIPIATRDTQLSEFKVMWKTQYGLISQATRRIMKDNAGTMKGVCGDWDHTCLKDKYAKYFTYIKSCNEGAGFGICWHSNSKFYYLNGNPITWGIDIPGVILSNGILISFVQIAMKNFSSRFRKFNNLFGSINLFSQKSFFVILLFV